MAPEALRKDAGGFDRRRVVQVAHDGERPDRKAPRPALELRIVLRRRRRPRRRRRSPATPRRRESRARRARRRTLDDRARRCPRVDGSSSGFSPRRGPAASASCSRRSRASSSSISNDRRVANVDRVSLRFVSGSNEAKNIGAPSQSCSTASSLSPVPIVVSSQPPGRSHSRIRASSGPCSARGMWPNMNSDMTRVERCWLQLELRHVRDEEAPVRNAFPRALDLHGRQVDARVAVPLPRPARAAVRPPPQPRSRTSDSSSEMRQQFVDPLQPGSRTSPPTPRTARRSRRSRRARSSFGSSVRAARRCRRAPARSRCTSSRCRSARRDARAR